MYDLTCYGRKRLCIKQLAKNTLKWRYLEPRTPSVLIFRFSEAEKCQFIKHAIYLLP